MILCISTSHPVASVALVDGDQVVWSHRDLAPRSASAKCLEFLEGLDLGLLRTGFVADVGPGSFTGVKVGVTLVKTFGWLMNLPVAGVSSFDLIDARGPAKVGAKRGEYWLREPERQPKLVVDPAASPESFEPPLAERIAAVIDQLVWIEPAQLLPRYGAEPSISQPKRAFGDAG
jgi:tRNA A37 threonylcarbamoyladenosine modification protein TsaB